MGVLNVAFVIDDIADTFELDTLSKSLVVGSTFFGKCAAGIM